eukprot:jgi/Chrzof1/2812/UNPLg00727.t1
MPRASQRRAAEQQAEQAKQLHGRHLIKTFQDPQIGKTKKHHGRIHFRGAQSAPVFYYVVYEAGDEERVMDKDLKSKRVSLLPISKQLPAKMVIPVTATAAELEEQYSRTYGSSASAPSLLQLQQLQHSYNSYQSATHQAAHGIYKHQQELTALQQMMPGSYADNQISRLAGIISQQSQRSYQHVPTLEQEIELLFDVISLSSCNTLLDPVVVVQYNRS